jgi:hypothetical protein
VTAPEFSFTLECQAPAVSPEMLRDLVAQVLGAVGCAGDVDRAVAGIAAAVGGRAPDDRLELLFRADGGELSIALSSGADPVWRTSCPIP